MSNTDKIVCPHCDKDVYIYVPFIKLRINKAHHEENNND